MRELPVVLARIAPLLPEPLESAELAWLVSMQELQSAFVYAKVLAKKTKVRPSTTLTADSDDDHNLTRQYGYRARAWCCLLPMRISTARS